MDRILETDNNRKDAATPLEFIFDSPDAKGKTRNAEKGFTLVEVTTAMVVFLVCTLGVFISFTFAVSYNSGNASRAQALAILQQEIEQLRSAKFTPTVTDPVLAGGEKTPKTVTMSDGNKFRVDVTIDDDPFTPNTQIDPTKVFKEITVRVALERPTPGWQTSVPATMILRRVRGN